MEKNRPMTKVGQRAALIRPLAKRPQWPTKSAAVIESTVVCSKFADYPYRPHCSRARLRTAPRCYFELVALRLTLCLGEV